MVPPIAPSRTGRPAPRAGLFPRLGPMLALGDAVARATGWRRRLIALLCGAFGALALAPVGFTPALVVPMMVAVWLLDGCAPVAGRWSRPAAGTLRRAFEAGWWWGFGYFLAGFWWLGSAFLLDPEFTWALPLGVLGVPAFLGVFTGVGFALARLAWVPGGARVFALALGLGSSEWARGHVFTGFPWNALGMGLGGTLVTAQGASLVGLDGLTLLTIALFAAPATFRHDGRWRARPALVAAGALALVGGYGALRLARGTVSDVPGVVVRLMQPGLQPDATFSYARKDEIVADYVALSGRYDAAKRIALADVTMLVWPESAFPFLLDRDPGALATIAAALPARTTLVTGAARDEDVPASDGHPEHSVYYNSIEVIDGRGAVLDRYDKVHLVPFGEYLPFEGVLSALGLRNFVAIPGGFVPGVARRHALSVPGLPPASPLICYEAIFPGAVGAGPTPSGARPRYLLNVTNDGWFGTTAGPSQHFAQVRLRAIEEGLPLIRDAATGVSAIVDPYGRVLDALPLGVAGILDGRLPDAIAPPLDARHGGLMTALVWIGTLLCLIGTQGKRGV